MTKVKTRKMTKKEMRMTYDEFVSRKHPKNDIDVECPFDVYLKMLNNQQLLSVERDFQF